MSTQCKRRCPGGNPCDCDGNVYHPLHCCRKPDCPCHSRQRYDLTVDHRPQPSKPRRIWRVEPLPYVRTAQMRLVIPDADGRPGLEEE